MSASATLDGYAQGFQTGAQFVRSATQRVAATVPGSTDEVGPALASFLPGTKSADPSTWPPPPSPWYFLLYALFIPLAPLAQGVAGDTNNALSRLAFLTIIPFGFIFGLIAVINDYFVMFSDPAHFFTKGSQRVPPFTWFGMDHDNQSPYLTLPSKAAPCAPPSFTEVLMGSLGNLVKGPLILALPALRFAAIASPAASSLVGAIEAVVNPTLAVTKSAVTALAVPVEAAAGAAVVATDKARTGLRIATQVGNLAATGASALGTAASRPGSMVGGKRSDYPEGKRSDYPEDGQSITPFDTIVLTAIAALIGGGAILTAGRQYAWATGPSDSPPLAGRV